MAYPRVVIVTVHGQESTGQKMAELSDWLSGESFASDCVFENIKYTRLLTITNFIGWVRTMTAKYVASALESICYKYPYSKILVIAHSNGTRAVKIAMVNRDDVTVKWPEFRVDSLILLGSPIERGFDWSVFPDTNVVNFVSTNDNVVLFGRLYGMGRAGRYGFYNDVDNLDQVIVRWGHSGFMGRYNLLRNVIKNQVEIISGNQ